MKSKTEYANEAESWATEIAFTKAKNKNRVRYNSAVEVLASLLQARDELATHKKQVLLLNTSERFADDIIANVTKERDQLKAELEKLNAKYKQLSYCVRRIGNLETDKLEILLFGIKNLCTTITRLESENKALREIVKMADFRKASPFYRTLVKLDERITALRDAGIIL